MRWDSGGDREPTEFERARRETVRCHEELYASATLGQAGTWLAKPHRLMVDALELVSSGKPVVAYDLGAGIGRHTIPLLRELPDGSDVFAVDLLPSALRSLENAVPPGLRTHLRTRPADLDGFEFEVPAGLILAFSAVEHLRDLKAVRSLLDRCRAATKPGGQRPDEPAGRGRARRAAQREPVVPGSGRAHGDTAPGRVRQPQPHARRTGHADPHRQAYPAPPAHP